MCFSLAWLVLLYLKQLVRTCRGWTADLQLRVQVSTTLTVSLGGEGDTEEPASVPLGHTVPFWTAPHSSCHTDAVYTPARPLPSPKSWYQFTFFLKHKGSKDLQPPWSLGHQAEDTTLQISTRQEAQNGKGNHVPFKGIFNSFLF